MTRRTFGAAIAATPSGKPLEFRTTGQSKDVTLAPINSVFDKRYSVYWQVS
jgi:hypothetical protein